MMKRLFIITTALFVFAQTFAQKREEITKKNSWLKAGVTAGIPVGDASNYSISAAGVELAGQLMKTNHYGIGIASGYVHFFPKNDVESFGSIPLDLMLRYYPKSKGIFVGVNGGYTFLTNMENVNGGLNVKPQIGYHNYSWNIYGFYNHIFMKEGWNDIQTAGITATYNIRFK